MRKFLKLRCRMVERDLLQKDVARLAGMCPNTLSDRMMGKHPWTADQMAAVGAVLDIPPAEYHLYFFN